jgi:phosphopantothenoylcysteine decarboxylase/phosphopantothenate--cysteine ligase
MHDAVMRRASAADVIVMAAAVADYTPLTPLAGKLAKTDAPMTLALQRTKDILGELGSMRDGARHPLLVGFAAETSDLLTRARDKRTRKQVDLIVANDVSAPDRGFEADTNAVTIIGEHGEQVVPLQAKTHVAAVILDRVEALLHARAASPA